MNAAGPVVEHVDPLTAPEATLRATARHIEAMRAERLPDDPPVAESARLRELRVPGTAERRHLLIWDHDLVVAHAAIRLPEAGGVRQADVDLGVLPGWRGHGLARSLLAGVVDLAEHSGVPVLRTTSSSRVPAGEAALRHLGARVVMRQQFMQLDLRDLSAALLADRVAGGGARAAAYRVWQNVDTYPAERLEDIARIHDVMATAPQGEKAEDHRAVTPEHLRQHESILAATGRRRLTTFAEPLAGGPVVAFTELYWSAGRPEIMVQHATAVHPDHRRHALGRWIKDANLHAARDVNPAARWVRAGNTADNAGMLAINRALGFVPYETHTDWHLDSASLRKR